MADNSERALQQLTKSIAVAYELTRKLRQQAADAAQHATLLEQSLWQAVGALKRAQRLTSQDGGWVSTCTDPAESDSCKR